MIKTLLYVPPDEAGLHRLIETDLLRMTLKKKRRPTSAYLALSVWRRAGDMKVFHRFLLQAVKVAEFSAPKTNDDMRELLRACEAVRDTYEIATGAGIVLRQKYSGKAMEWPDG